jgi:hypothetical protein
VATDSVCVKGGENRVVWRAYTGFIHCIFDQILNLQDCFTTPGGLRQIKKCKKNRHSGFGVFLVIWSMPLRIGLKQKLRRVGCTGPPAYVA